MFHSEAAADCNFRGKNSFAEIELVRGLGLQVLIQSIRRSSSTVGGGGGQGHKDGDIYSARITNTVA
jgi:hypothetical protein